MKISLEWLAQYVALPDDLGRFLDLLTFAGVEVESVASRGADFPNVVVAQILESQPHPNADRLSVCRVDDGSGQPRQIVCGAKNYRVGDRVPLALPGAVLPGDFTIKRSKLRGVESEGMMCSAKELRMAEDAEGLLILPPDTPVGRPISEVFPPDTVVEVEITPNRPDLLCHYGIAREVGAITGAPVTAPALRDAAPAGGGSVAVSVADPEGCPLYTARVIRGVRVGPSPGWLVRRLEAAGVRAINNVVDITNYVLLELGHPLHAFDAAKLAGSIEVRSARPGEPFLALDGKTYTLREKDIVIASGGRPVALGGVMGGEDSGVTASTVDLVLESARFAPNRIRRTARDLGLMSESSYRFERGVDPNLALIASRRATDLILELAGGTAEPALSACGQIETPAHEVSLRPGRAAAVLGAPVDPSAEAGWLGRLGLERMDDTTWRVPSFRPDLTREIDLVEEIIRLRGLDQLPADNPVHLAGESAADRAHDAAMGLRRTLAGLGFFEAHTLTLLSRAALADDVFGDGGAPVIRNPLGEDQAALRPGLAPGLLHCAAINVRRGAAGVRLFEIGRVFAAADAAETPRLGLVMSGIPDAPAWRDRRERAWDLFDLKGVIDRILPGAVYRRAENPRLALCLQVWAGDQPAGWLGQLKPARAKELDLRHPALVAELDLGLLCRSEETGFAYRDLPRYPAVVRDIALLAPSDLPHEQIARCIAEAGEALLESARIFDLFEDPEKLPPGRKSLAYSLTYRAGDRTLSSDEANAAHEKVLGHLKQALDVQVR